MSANGYRKPRDLAEKIERRLARYPEARQAVANGEGPEWLPRALDMLADGFSGVQIAEALGMSRSNLYQYLKDPTYEKNYERKRKYGGTCADCGGPTQGSGGFAKQSKRCLSCQQNRNAERNERIIEAWSEGEPAGVIAEREGMSETSVQSLVNSHRQNGREIPLHRSRNREHWETIRRLRAEGWTNPEIAEEIGSTAASVSNQVQNMRSNGIEVAESMAGPIPNEERREELVRLWNDGLSMAEIGEALGITASSVGTQIFNLRAQGYDLPYRRKVAA